MQLQKWLIIIGCLFIVAGFCLPWISVHDKKIDEVITR